MPSKRSLLLKHQQHVLLSCWEWRAGLVGSTTISFTPISFTPLAFSSTTPQASPPGLLPFGVGAPLY